MSRARLTDGPLLWRLGAGDPPSGPHVAVVPGAQVPLLPVDLPDGLRGLARERVAARHLAEALALPPSALELHPFAPDGKKAHFSGMVVADTSVAAAWRADLHPGCIAVLPDYLSLPCIAGVWTVEIGPEDTVAVRLTEADGFTAEPELAIRLMAGTAKPRAVLRLGPAEHVVDDYLAALGVPVLDTVEAAAREVSAKPLRWTAAAGGVDLRTAPSALYDRLGAGLARWRWPVLLGVLALAAWLATLVLETRDLQARADRAAAQTRDLVRQHFVPEGPILNVRAQVQAAHDAAAVPEIGARDLPPLVQLQRAAPVLMRDDLALEAAEYRADTGLVTAVTAKDFAALDTLVADLRGAGFLVEQLDSRSQTSGGVAARLRLLTGPGL